MFLSNEELEKLFERVDSARCWHFPKGFNIIEMSKPLIAEGYKFWRNGKEVTLDGLRCWFEDELETHDSGLSCHIKFYDYIDMYHDHENKVVYIRTGPIRCEDFYC